METQRALQSIEPFNCTSMSVGPPSVRANISNQLRKLKLTATSRLRKLDPVKMAYLRTSFIFGFAVLVTWIPSSVNRLYSIANDGHINFQLSAVSGTVLPLQGVWNALIYFTTSWNTVLHICNGTAETIFSGKGRHRTSSRSPRSRFAVALRSRSSNIGQEYQRHSLRLDDMELELCSPPPCRATRSNRLMERSGADC